MSAKLEPGQSAFVDLNAGTVQFVPAIAAPTPRPKPAACIHLGAAIEGDEFPPKDGLGDMIERRLSSIKIPVVAPDGITKERWAEIKSEVTGGLAGKDCSGCSARQAFGNWLGRKLGVGKSNAELQVIYEVLGLEAGRTLAVHACGVHGRCLPQPVGSKPLAEAPMTCSRCRKEGLGYEPAQAE